MFLIRDSKKIHNKVENPAVVYDGESSVLLKIGEKSKMEEFFTIIQERYRSFGFYDMADNIYLMDLPRDQEEIDKVFGICDYIGKLHKDIVNKRTIH